MFYSGTEGKRSAPFDMQIVDGKVDGLIRNFDASFKLMLKMLND